MRIRKRLPLTLCMAFIALASVAQSFDRLPRSVKLSLDPEVASYADSSLSVSCDNYIGAFTVIFKRLSETPTPLPDSLPYALQRNTEIGYKYLSLTGTASSSYEALNGSFPPGSDRRATVSLPFRAELGTGSLPNEDSYDVLVEAKLYQGSVGNLGPLMDTDTFVLSIAVDGLMEVEVLPPNASAVSMAAGGMTLHFGELGPATPDLTGARVYVRSNSQYTLSVTSRYGSLLGHVNAKDSSRVPYVFYINEQAKTLKANRATVLFSGEPPTGYLGRFYSLRFALSWPSDPAAILPSNGEYIDTLTFSLSAR